MHPVSIWGQVQNGTPKPLFDSLDYISYTNYGTNVTERGAYGTDKRI